MIQLNIDLLIGILIPFFGTALGAAAVLFIKREFNFLLEDFFTAVAAGIMTAASVWSLIIPATEESSHMGRWAFLPCLMGIVAGCGFMIVLDRATEKLFVSDGLDCKNINTVLAVTIHNIPEGMAVGCVFASAMENASEHLYAAAFLLSLGIAIQNIPEGAVISMPAYASGMSKIKALTLGILSGVVEPLGAVAALLMSRFIGALLPYFLSFAAGAMLFVVTQDMIPNIKYKGRFPLTGMAFTFGFLIMMSLDVALS